MRNTQHTFTLGELDAAIANLREFLRNPTLAMENQPKELLPTRIQIAGGRMLKRLEKKLHLKEEGMEVLKDTLCEKDSAGSAKLEEKNGKMHLIYKSPEAKEEYLQGYKQLLEEEVEVLLFQFDVKLLDDCRFNGLFIPYLDWWFDFEDDKIHENGVEA